MPLPASILRLARSKQFWKDYFWLTETANEYPELGDLRIEFPVSSAFSLLLQLDSHLWEQTLYLVAPPSRDPIQIAWDDQAHWHPHVLRWYELDLICRACSVLDPTMIHPDLPLLLLYRFAPITTDEDATLAFPLLRAAWQTLDLWTDDEVDEFNSLRDHRKHGFEWQYKEGLGWTLCQDPTLNFDAVAYSLRHTASPHFPFAQLADLVIMADKTAHGH